MKNEKQNGNKIILAHTSCIHVHNYSKKKMKSFQIYIQRKYLYFNKKIQEIGYVRVMFHTTVGINCRYHPQVEL